MSDIRFLICVEEQLDFPVLYASAKEGWASLTFTKSPPDNAKNMLPLLDSILKHVSPPQANVGEPFQMLVSNFVIVCSENDILLNLITVPITPKTLYAIFEIFIRIFATSRV